jgi:hypothetical protein
MNTPPHGRIILDGSAKVVGVVTQALTEEAVAALEVSTGRAPSWLTPVVVRNAAGGFDLTAHEKRRTFFGHSHVV